MAIDVERLKIVLYPEPVLRRKAARVEKITAEVRAVAGKMLQLMHEAPGVGLAAPQVGIGWRMFVANPKVGESEGDRVFINPVLLEPSKELDDYEEGCLSIPDVTAEIRRPKGITVEATDLEGKLFRLKSDELAARVWQHEYDHLDGVLIIDRMTPIDRMANQKLLREMEKGSRV